MSELKTFDSFSNDDLSPYQRRWIRFGSAMLGVAVLLITFCGLSVYRRCRKSSELQEDTKNEDFPDLRVASQDSSGSTVTEEQEGVSFSDSRTHETQEAI